MLGTCGLWAAILSTTIRLQGLEDPGRQILLGTTTQHRICGYPRLAVAFSEMSWHISQVKIWKALKIISQIGYNWKLYLAEREC